LVISVTHDRRYRMMQRRIRSVTCGIAVLTMLALVGSACSSDADTGTASQGCAELATVKDSLTALTQVEPVQDGLNALESAVATVKTDLQSAASAVSAELEPSVDQVQSSFDQLESSLQGVTTSNLAASAAEIGTALTAVGTALTDLKSELTEKCP
jgi:putative N-acetylmannosamine-6-phosphate epimerase